ncbi:DUF2336 domain-containing protein [Methylobacterium organophilum]|uniref:DUF2336 domain-containing protein n=1 Tax=Methylobacterium organophilum TaxID=410 RepID=A0ABQ4T256_METOR|nr:DUF2336 domain-containing protein [Methylobacterium organophilum]GJE25698.1 hypothetical protein LKMONMHP_0537 [Methylobacterium organophilum]
MMPPGGGHPYTSRRFEALISEIEAALACRDPSVQSALVLRSVDLLVKRWSCLPPESKAAYDNLLNNLLSEVDTAARTAFAEGLAPLRRGPPRTSARLAQDVDGAVSEPLLRRCRSLTEDVLCQVAVSCSDDHRRALAERIPVDTALSDLLLEHGSAGVATVLAGNRDAAISPAGFGAFLRHAGESEAVALALTRRRDLPEGYHGALAALAERRAQAALATNRLPARQITALLTWAKAKPATAASGRLDRFRASQAFIAERFDKAPVSPGMINRWLSVKRIEDALAAVACQATLPVDVVVAAYDEVDGRSIALILHGCGYPWATVKSLLLFGHGPEAARSAIAEAYELTRTLSPLSARRLLRLRLTPMGVAAFALRPGTAWGEMLDGRGREASPPALPRPVEAALSPRRLAKAGQAA